MTDVHCHVNSDFKDTEIIRIVNGTDIASSKQTLELAGKYKNVWVCVGIHPEESYEIRDVSHEIRQLRGMLDNKKVVGIGEVGLNFRQGITEEEKQKQKELLGKMVNLAVETELPIVIHNRNADEDIYSQLKTQSLKLKGILMHCFTRNLEFMQKMLPLGAYFSFGGMITRENNSRMQRVAKLVPNDRLLLETDAPYSAVDVKIVGEEVAKLKGLTPVEVEVITDTNSKVLFKRIT